MFSGVAAKVGVALSGRESGVVSGVFAYAGGAEEGGDVDGVAGA
jgi:hypothetical protein